MKKVRRPDARDDVRRRSERLNVVRVTDVPLREVSGICLRRGAGGALSLVAMGDRAATAAWAVLPVDPGDEPAWETADLRGLTGTKLPPEDTQIEAVCADGAGRLLLLQESPPRAELVDPAGRRVVAAFTLQVPEHHPLGPAWERSAGSRGEGGVFLANGHVLVAKEKDPAALIEFGPAGEAPSGFVPGAQLAPGAAWPVAEGEQIFVALATWLPDHQLEAALGDFSDLEVGPDGELYVLSDQSAAIARLADLAPDAATASARRYWQIEGLDGKAEGLAFTAAGRPLVALDTPKPRRNLVLLDPPVAV